MSANLLALAAALSTAAPASAGRAQCEAGQYMSRDTGARYYNADVCSAKDRVALAAAGCRLATFSTAGELDAVRRAAAGGGGSCAGGGGCWTDLGSADGGSYTAADFGQRVRWGEDGRPVGAAVAALLGGVADGDDQGYLRLTAAGAVSGGNSTSKGCAICNCPSKGG